MGARAMWVVRAALGAPRRALLVAVLALVAAAFAASQLQSGSPERLLAGAHSRVGAATQGQEQRFGGEPIVVDLRGELETTLAPQNLTTLLGLEQRLRKLPGVQTVIGPASFVDQAAAQMQAVVARELGPPAQRAEVAARSAVARARADGVRGKQLAEIDAAARLQSLGPQLRQQYQELFVRFGYVGIPSLSNANFVLQLVKGASLTPKKRFGWLFPSNRHALVLIRPRAGLDDARVRALGTQVSRLVAGTRLEGVTTNVAGAPLVVAAASASFAHDLLELAPFVLAAMLLALLLGLGLRARAVHLLLPAGGAALLTAGLSWPLGLGFTPATLAALPVVVGLALDYAVQLQARYWARRSAGVAPRDAAEQAVAQIGPTLLLAGGAMIAGFLVLVASPVPLVDRLAITLALGVAVSLVFVLVLGGPLLVARDRPGITAPRLSLPDLRVPYHVRMAALGIALGITVAGVALSAGTHVESDLRKLAGSDLPALKRLERLQHDLGTSGQLRVAVKARDVTDPAVLAWMARVEPKILALDPGLRPGPNLAAILQAGGGDTLPDRAAVQRLLGLIPPAFVSAVLARDHRRAELSFGVPLRSARDQAALIERMQRLLETAPAGVDAQAAGLLAMSAAGVSGLQDGRPWLLLLAAALVFALLYAARRRVDRALIPLLPALLAAAATTVAERALGFALSPLSATLDPLVLGVGVEFGLLLEARYHEERATAAPAAAARIAAERLGAPVAVAAGTVALGFAVLAFSALPALRQFGLVAAGELVLCVVAAIALVPALCAAADRRRTLRVSAPCGHAVAGTVRS